MAKRILFVFHGMGKYEEETFKQEVIEALEGGMALYPSLKQKKVENYINVIPIHYDELFEEERQRIAKPGQSVHAELTKIGAPVDVENLLNVLVGVDRFVDNDDFFHTHLLDVLLYRFTNLRHAVRIRAAMQMTKALKENGTAPFDVLAHSLGTGVAHDTLALLYADGGVRDPDTNEIHSLDPLQHKLEHLYMVANVSHVLRNDIQPTRSKVRPGDGGIVSAIYHEFRHDYDPITWVEPFNPLRDADWPESVSGRYSLKKPFRFTPTAGHTHDLSHYLYNPDVNQAIIFHTLGEEKVREEMTQATQAYMQKTEIALYNKAGELLDSIKNEGLTGVSAISDVIKAFNAFYDDVKDNYDFKN